MDIERESAFPQRTLVTGASGFIGSHLSSRLSGSGAQVHAISRTLRAGPIHGVTWWQGDLTDIAQVRRILSAVKPEIVFHLAGHVAGSRNLALALPTFHGNLASTVNLLTAATEIGCRRIVLIGSMEEPDPLQPEAVPCSPYAASKWASGTYGRMFQQLYDTPVVNARVFMTYGPGQKDISKLVPHVILSLLQDQPPKLGNGNRPVDWVYVDDVVDGLLALARVPGLEGRTIDLGSGTLVPIRTVVDRIATMVRSPVEPLFAALPERPLERVRVADTAASHTTINWRPKTSLSEGLQLTVDWYRAHLEAMLHPNFSTRAL